MIGEGVMCPKKICHGKVKHGIQKDFSIPWFWNVVSIKYIKTMCVLVCVCFCAEYVEYHAFKHCLNTHFEDTVCVCVAEHERNICIPASSQLSRSKLLTIDLQTDLIDLMLETRAQNTPQSIWQLSHTLI